MVSAKRNEFIRQGGHLKDGAGFGGGANLQTPVALLGAVLRH